MDIQEEIANALHQADCGCGETVGEHDQPYWAQARALMPLVKRARAEALREVARKQWVEDLEPFYVTGLGRVSAFYMLDEHGDRIERGEDR